MRWFGTQTASRGDGPIQLWDIDPAVTDEERVAWNVPHLAVLLQWAEERNREKEEFRLQVGNAYYLVGGKVPFKELLQLATSIP